MVSRRCSVCPYDYGDGVNNNGDIHKITDNVDAGRTVNYTYDELGRLKTAVTQGSTAYPKWGLQWNYDRYGNRTAQNQTAGSWRRSKSPKQGLQIESWVETWVGRVRDESDQAI